MRQYKTELWKQREGNISRQLPYIEIQAVNVAIQGEMKEDGCGICLQAWRYLSTTCFNTVEKVSRRTLKKEDKNKVEPQLKERQMFHRELGTMSRNMLS